mmetsp:Transcript_6595/g.15231  ORF Transcript_6595/g.15231 Transcript_6595/m.15231 type:complete len:246 (-) Transcript_6595:376-1113(-)
MILITAPRSKDLSRTQGARISAPSFFSRSESSSMHSSISCGCVSEYTSEIAASTARRPLGFVPLICSFALAKCDGCIGVRSEGLIGLTDFLLLAGFSTGRSSSLPPNAADAPIATGVLGVFGGSASASRDTDCVPFGVAEPRRDVFEGEPSVNSSSRYLEGKLDGPSDRLRSSAVFNPGGFLCGFGLSTGVSTGVSQFSSVSPPSPPSSTFQTGITAISSLPTDSVVSGLKISSFTIVPSLLVTQ